MLLLPVLWSCAEGAETTAPTSSIQVADQHYVWGFNGPTAFSGFPVQATEIVPSWGTFTLSSNSQYQITLNGASGTDAYGIDETGELSVFVVPSSRAPTIRFLGGYGIEGNTGGYYFTDRYTTSSSNNLGLFWGTRILPGLPDVEHGWHFFSQHVIFGHNLDIGRTVAGNIDIDDQGAITGGGFESTRATLTFTGSAKSLGSSRVDLTVVYDDGQGSDSRLFQCSAGPRITIMPTIPTPPTGITQSVKPGGRLVNEGWESLDERVDAPRVPREPARFVPHLILGIDADTNDGEAGLVAMIAVRTDTADPAKLDGTYHVGLHTIFVDVTNPGTDVAAGTITFDNGSFDFKGTGAGGISFSYDGTYVLAANGKITITVYGTGETWTGAVDQDYRTVVIADNEIEPRSGNKPPELNLFIAIRQSTP